MPSTYKHKSTGRGKTMNYSAESLKEALKACKDGMSIRKSAEMYKVPKSTLADRVTGKIAVDAKHGRPPAVPEEVEVTIVKSVKLAAKLGVGLSRKQILNRTNVLCQRMNFATSYPNFTAGKDWWQGLKRWHPELVIRKPEKLSNVRARDLNSQIVEKYFKDLACVVENLNLSEKPNLIWNCDETGFNFEHVPVKIVSEKGDRAVVSKTMSRSNNITAMACVSAAGERMPPLVIAKGKTQKCLSAFNTAEAPEGTVWAYQKSGWMTDDIGERWFGQVFLHHIGPERPQLLILDGHSSHESLAILQRATDEKIFIIALPPHSTHYLQPLDRCVFGPMKTAYNTACSEFLQSNPLHLINKWSFPTMLTSAWNSGMSVDNIQSGFRACGIYPLNKDAIPTSAFNPSVLTDVPVSNTTDQMLTAVPYGGESSVHIATNGDAAVEIFDQSVDELEPSIDPSLPVVDISEPSIETSVPVVDISDPAQLLDLISSGEFLLELEEQSHALSIDEDILSFTPNTSTDVTQESSVVSLDTSTDSMTPHGEPSVTASNTVDSTMTDFQDLSMEKDSESRFLNDNICSLFLPKKIVKRKASNENKRKVESGHRLLTSEDIINQKRVQEQKKMEKEQRAILKPKKIKKEKAVKQKRTSTSNLKFIVEEIRKMRKVKV